MSNVAGITRSSAIVEKPCDVAWFWKWGKPTEGLWKCCCRPACSSVYFGDRNNLASTHCTNIRSRSELHAVQFISLPAKSLLSRLYVV